MPFYKPDVLPITQTTELKQYIREERNNTDTFSIGFCLSAYF